MAIAVSAPQNIVLFYFHAESEDYATGPTYITRGRGASG